MRFVLALLFIFMLTACASLPDNFVFDGSTAQSTQQDIEFVTGKLSNKKKLEFVIALLEIQFSDVKSVYDVVGDPAMEGFNYHLIGKKIDGLTYDEVLALADQSPSQVTTKRR